MKITLENTTQIIELVTAQGSVPARVWVGETTSGVKVHALITRIAALQTDDLSQFEKELRERREPEPIQVFPLRMIL